MIYCVPMSCKLPISRYVLSYFSFHCLRYSPNTSYHLICQAVRNTGVLTPTCCTHTHPSHGISPNLTQSLARRLCGVWLLSAGLPVFIRPRFLGDVYWAPSASATRVALPPDTPKPGHNFNGPGTPVPSLQG